MFRLILTTGLAAACAFALPAQKTDKPVKPKKIYSNSYLGKAPPELVAAKGASWLNQKGPLSLASLKGRVVWLEFSFIH